MKAKNNYLVCTKDKKEQHKTAGGIIVPATKGDPLYTVISSGDEDFAVGDRVLLDVVPLCLTVDPDGRGAKSYHFAKSEHVICLL